MPDKHQELIFKYFTIISCTTALETLKYGELAVQFVVRTNR